MDWLLQHHEAVRNFAITLVAIVGVGLAIWRIAALHRQAAAAAEQARIARRSHVTELFAKAVEQLGHERLEIRLGGIYALQRIWEDFPDFAEFGNRIIYRVRS